jgi:hypothetical protein
MPCGIKEESGFIYQNHDFGPKLQPYSVFNNYGTLANPFPVFIFAVL